MSGRPPYFGPDGDCRVAAGEILNVSVVLRSSEDGADIDLTGRTFALSVYKASDEAEVYSTSAAGDGTSALLSVDGDTTRSWRDTYAGVPLRIMLVEQFADGFSRISDGGLNVVAASRSLTPSGSSPTDVGPVVQVVFIEPLNRTLYVGLGAPGLVGPANTLSIGTVATLSQGAQATASITGTAPNQTLNLGLPTGAAGSAGPPSNITAGTVTTGAPGSSASVSLTGTAPNYTLSFTIPRGDVGAIPAFSIGTITTGAPGTSAGGSITGTVSNPVLNLTIPRGDVGATPAFSIGTVTSGNAAVTITGTQTNPILNFVLQAGPSGAPGAAGSTGLSGFVSTVLYTTLNGITPATGAGTTAFVVGPDTGSHTDANGATLVPNTGQFSYQASPPGWIRVGSATSPSDPAALASLAGLVGGYVVTGTLPTATGLVVTPAVNAYLRSANVVSAVDGTIKAIVIDISTVGDGTGTLSGSVDLITATHVSGVCIAQIGGTGYTKITATGIQTLFAGVHFPLGIRQIAGTKFYFGSTTGGAKCSGTLNTGAGATIAIGFGSYYDSTTSVNNYDGNFAVIIDTNTLVTDAIAAAKLIPREARTITEKMGPHDRLLVSSGGNQTFPNSNNVPFYNDGVLEGIDYNGGTAGDVYVSVRRPVGGVLNFVGGWRQTLATGNDLYAACPAPFGVKAGDILHQIPLTGAFTTKNWSAQPGLLLTTSTLDGAVGATNQTLPGMRAVISRPPTAKELAMKAGRGRTTLFDQRFRGATLPSATITFTATTVNGSQTLSAVTGNPVLGVAVTGTGIPTLPGPTYMITGNLLSVPANAGNAGVTMSQTPWASSGTGWTAGNPYLKMVSPGAANWNRYFVDNRNITAQRVTYTTEIELGSTDNVFGLCSLSQNASLTPLGSIIHIDAPAAMLRAYLWNGSGAPTVSATPVALPWVPAATDVYRLGIDIDRGRMTVTCTNTATGQTATLRSVSAGTAPYGGVMSGRIGAHFYSGTGNCAWRFIKAQAHFRRGQGVIWSQDSVAHGVGANGQADDNFDYTWPNRVEDAAGRPNFLNFAKSGASATDQILSICPWWPALVGTGATDGVNVELIWFPGVNPDNSAGVTDAQRYGTYLQATINAAAMCATTGTKFTIGMFGGNSTAVSYAKYTLDNIISGVIGDYEIIDMNLATATSASARGSYVSTTVSPDGLHFDVYWPTAAAAAAANFLGQRPDMNADA